LILITGVVYAVAFLVWLVLPFFNDLLFDSDDEFFGVGLALPLTVTDIDNPRAYAVNLAVVLGLVLLAQWAFLRPARSWMPKLATEGRPLKSAVVAAAAMAMLLTVGLITLLLELPNWWERGVDAFDDAWSFYATAGTAMVLLWGLWAWVFFVYWRQGDRYTQLGRMIRALVAGSLLEGLVAIPVHVALTRQRECYCMRGTYTTLILAGTVLLWAFGPGIILLYYRERYRRARLFPMCSQCGYDLRSGHDVCPECGTPVMSSG
jgi:hypothetical protein